MRPSFVFRLQLALGLASLARCASFAVSAAPSITEGKSYSINLPGPPFGVVATHDQQWVFVSISALRAGQPIGIAVLHFENERYVLARVASTPSHTTGLVLTHDGKLLVATGGDCVMLFSVERMTRGAKDALVTSLRYDPTAGSVYVNVTADDRTLFISDEHAGKITVMDLAQVRADGFRPASILARIPVGLAPIALTFSPDQRWLYTTSQRAAEAWGWPKTIKRENSSGNSPAPRMPEGAIVVLDVEKARSDPANAIAARVPAGGSPVRLAIAPAGDRLYVTLRNDNALRVYDAEKTRQGADDARLATIPVGDGPVPVLVIDDGRRVLVGNSNRFGAAPDEPSTVSIVAVDKATDGAAAVIGTLSVGAFPREFHLAADGRTIFLTNFRSRSLLVLDAQHLPIIPTPGRAAK